MVLSTRDVLLLQHRASESSQRHSDDWQDLDQSHVNGEFQMIRHQFY